MGPMWIPQTQKASAHTHITSEPHVIFRLLFLLLSPLVGLMDNVWLSLKGGLKSTSQIEAVCTWPQKLRPQLSIICPPPTPRACDWGSKGDWISQEPSICSGPIEAYKLFHERWLSQEDYEKEIATRRQEKFLTTHVILNRPDHTSFPGPHILEVAQNASLSASPRLL